jgi:hypothetical protein
MRIVVPRNMKSIFRRPTLYRRALALLFAALILSLAQCSKTNERQIPVTRLSTGFEPLRAQFNRDGGKVRLLLLLDPT